MLHDNKHNARYIDISALPMKQWGNRMIIDWNKSINIPVSFTYNNTSGVLFITENIDANIIRIYIDGYTSNTGYIIHKSTFINGKLGGALRKTVSFWRPDLVEYFVNKKDADTHSVGSNKEVLLRCPICGYIKSQTVNELSHNGFHCNHCDDGFSYPSKLMFSVLSQIGIDFIPELSKKTVGFEWLERYKFDFYFCKNNKKYVVEMDGGFHYRDRFGQLSDTRKRDLIKDNLAYAHNISVIRIDCNYDGYDKFEYIKNNILNSSLYDILELCNYDISWEACHQFCINSLLKCACDYWNAGMQSSQEIAEVLKLSRSTIHNYLVDGAKLGLCNYTPSLAMDIRNSKGGQANRKKHSKPLAVYNNDILVCVAFSIKELCRNSLKSFGKKFNQAMISAACNERISHAYGYTMKFITHEEYEQFALQLNETIQN